MNKIRHIKYFFIEFVLLWQEAVRIKALISDCQDDIERLVDIVIKSKKFRPSQKRSEIKALINIIKSHGFSRICEIGNYKGGSLILISQVADDNALLVSIDINYPITRKVINKKLLKPRQKIISIKGDSKNLMTIKKVEKALRDKKLDLLFIDGDHSYEGVKKDYELYSKLVRKGGYIIFHDIHPDSFMKSGIKTSSYVGGVPKFWSEIKQENLDYDEVIENISQDGYGLGILVNK